MYTLIYQKLLIRLTITYCSTNKKYYGIEETALRLFESYLNERQQYVDFDGTPSNYNRILTGVPQGSILGPLLFIIYINDIAQSSNHFNFIIYADDTTLCSTLKINADATQLNMELNNVSRWLNLNKLSLNVKKTKAMAFHMPQKKIIHLYNLIYKSMGLTLNLWRTLCFLVLQLIISYTGIVTSTK